MLTVQCNNLYPVLLEARAGKVCLSLIRVHSQISNESIEKISAYLIGLIVFIYKYSYHSSPTSIKHK